MRALTRWDVAKVVFTILGFVSGVLVLTLTFFLLLIEIINRLSA